MSHIIYLMSSLAAAYLSGNSSLVVNGRSISRDSTTSDESSQGRVPSTRLVDPNEGLTLTFPTS